MPPRKARCAILAADFNKEIIDAMIDEAQRAAVAGGAEVGAVIRVAGCYEIPLLADVELANPAIDVLIVLGYIERGETLHGEVMGHVVHRVLVDLQLKYRKPLGVGIIGPGATLEQAARRKVDYAHSAVRAALRSWHLLSDG